MSPLVFNSIQYPGELFLELAKMYEAAVDDNYLCYDNSIVKGQGNRIYLGDSITILIGSTYHFRPFNFIIKRNYIKPLVILFYYKIANQLIFWCEICGEGIEIKPLENFSIKKTTDSNSVWEIPADSTIELMMVYINFDWIIDHIDSDKNQFIENMQQLSGEFRLKLKNYFIDDSLIQLVNALFEQNKTKIIDVTTFELLINDFTHRYQKIFTTNLDKTKRKLVGHLDNARMQLVSDLSKPAPSLKELCKLTGLNRLTFQHKFKEQFGKTFYQYYQDNRFAKARELLLSGKYTVSQVAYLINCKNLSHFSKEFHKRYAVLPSELIK